MKIKKYILASTAIAAIAAPVAATVACNEKDVTMGVTLYKGDDNFITIIKNALETEAKKHNISYDIIDSQNDQQKQLDQIDALIRKGVKVLVINLVNPNSASSVIAKAKAKNLPIVFFNKEPSQADMNSYEQAYYVGTASNEAGTMQAQVIYDDMTHGAIKDKNDDGKLKYFVIGGEAGHADAIGRSKWVRKGIISLIATKGVNASKFNDESLKNVGTTSHIKVDANHKIYIKSGLTETQVKNLFEDITNGNTPSGYGAEWTDWTQAKGLEKTSPHLTADDNDKKSIDFIIANNDNTALGAISALKQAGYVKYVEAYPASTATNHLPIYGVDATSPAKESIKDGWLGGTVLNDGEKQGRIIALVVKNILAGKKGKDVAEWDAEITSTYDASAKALRVPYVAAGRNSDIVNS